MVGPGKLAARMPALTAWARRYPCDIGKTERVEHPAVGHGGETVAGREVLAYDVRVARCIGNGIAVGISGALHEYCSTGGKRGCSERSQREPRQRFPEQQFA